MNIETSIDCLPAEMICEILKNLNLNDQIQCKLVSKRWYSIVTESSKIIKLVLINDEEIKRKIYGIDELVTDDMFIRLRWYYSNELVNNDLQYCEFNLFQVNLKRQILSNLKYLKIDKSFEIHKTLKFDFNQLNLLNQLIHLEINCYVGEVHIKLNLLELEVLRINFNFSCYFTIEECPKLKILYYHDYKATNNVRLIMKYPESIKDLDSRFYGSELAQFKNVEYLKCGWDFDRIDKNTLSKLKKLKEIHYDDSVNRLFEFLDEVSETYEDIKLTLRNFLGMIKKLRMFDLKVFCFGLQITDHNINQIDFGLRSNDFEYVDLNYFYAVNYKYLQDSLPFIDEVDYTRLVNLINPIPTDYFNKFFAISQVSANGKLDQVHFLWFLKNLKVLKRLTLKSTNLNQSFYDELSTFCSLIWFKLDEETNKELDFNFLIQFNELEFLILKQELSLKSIKSLIYAFGRLNYLNANRLEFRFKKQKFRILRYSDVFNCYHILGSHYRDVKKSELSLNELISYFEKLD